MTGTAGQKRPQTNVRLLRGHNGAVTALHCVTRKEVWDLVGDREDAGFFISGSTDCLVCKHLLLIISELIFHPFFESQGSFVKV